MHKTAAPWEELREKYEAGGYTYMQLAKEYGVSVQTVGRHARKENWVSGCRNERRRRAESRDCLLEMTRALMRGAKRAAEEAEKGEACTKELKELAGILQTLAGLEKELGGGTAAQTVQVLTVTHSPQVAACGNSHFKVEKKTADNVTTTYVYELDKTARFEEIARMLAGEHITDEARAAARVLLTA